VNPLCSAGEEIGGPNPRYSAGGNYADRDTSIEETLGGFDISHLWSRSLRKGICSEVTVSYPESKNPSRTQIPSHLSGGGHQWSTLGGDSRSFVQIIRSDLPRKSAMEGRGQGAPRPPYGGARQGRNFGDYGASNDQRPFVRPWEDRRGGYRGGRPPHQHWR
jgi:hypothetical protein